jgi:hypothetical protein
MENSSLMWKRLPAFVARVKGRNDFRRMRFLRVLVDMGAFCEEGSNWFDSNYIPWRKVQLERAFQAPGARQRLFTQVDKPLP